MITKEQVYDCSWICLVFPVVRCVKLQCKARLQALALFKSVQLCNLNRRD